jgi:hypothetical protein
VVRFVPFVGDDDGQEGVVTGEVDLGHARHGQPKNLRLSSSLWLRDDEKRWERLLGGCRDGRRVANRASELVVFARQPWQVVTVCGSRRGKRRGFMA